MIVKQFAAPALVLCLSVMLGSCSPFAGFVADHWPHWAGGLPADVPPRPGAPGYNEFIAHGQPSQVPAPAAAADARPAVTQDKSAAPGQNLAGTDRKPAAAGATPAATDEATGAPATPSRDGPPGGSNVVQGGLY